MSESKGPYTLERLEYSLWYAVGPAGKLLLGAGSKNKATPALNNINKAHHHALAAQADRVRQLEEALRDTLEMLGASLVGGRIKRERIEAAHAALTPPAKGETHG